MAILILHSLLGKDMMRIVIKRGSFIDFLFARATTHLVEEFGFAPSHKEFGFAPSHNGVSLLKQI